MARWAQGLYQPKHPDKYIGKKTPRYRSSWEWAFMNFCDNNPSIMQWASESIQIPYRHPLTGKNTIYVPDFFIVYNSKGKKRIAELIEIKPNNQAKLENVGKNIQNQASYIVNKAKWEAAGKWCKHKGIRFRILTESDIFK
jgi:hypothetical protein|tara:strand:- start:1360 stop:1782 length:423 start_codon:yes stop_codon:yes gene_type:complete